MRYVITLEFDNKTDADNVFDEIEYTLGELFEDGVIKDLPFLFMTTEESDDG